MLSRFVHDDAFATWKHGFFGLLMLFLALGIGSGIVGTFLANDAKVLGTESGTSGTIGTGQGEGGQGTILRVTEGQTQPTIGFSNPTPTDVPVFQPTTEPTQTIRIEPTPTEAPRQEVPFDEIIKVNDPTTELIIRNEDETLIITTTEDDTIFAKVDETTPSVTQPELVQVVSPTLAQGQTQPVYNPTPTSTQYQFRVLPTSTPIPPTIQPSQDFVPTPTPQQNIIASLPKAIIDIFIPPVQAPTIEDPLAQSPTTQQQTNPIRQVLSPIIPDSILNIFAPAPTIKSNTQLAYEQSIAVEEPSLAGSIGNSVRKALFFGGADEEAPFEINSLRGPSRAFAESEVNAWLARYQFQVWPIGNDRLAIARNGFITVTKYPIKLGLRKLSLKATTENGDHQIIYYADSVAAYLASIQAASEDGFDQPFILEEKNGEMTYSTEISSKQLMLAFIPSRVCRKVEVSADTQEIKNLESCSIIDSAVDKISLAL